MSDNTDLVAEFREDQGKGASRRLRKEGKVPAILYGAGRPPCAISLQHNKLLRALEDESFYSSVLNIQVGDKNQEAILKDLQRHPAKQQILHVDLQRIVAGEAIRMNVPLHFVGEDVAPGVKMQGGVVSHLINEVEVVCLPKHLPEYLEVDVSALDIDSIIHLSEVPLPKGVEIPSLAQGDDYDQPVVSISKPRGTLEAEEETETDATDAETEAAPEEGGE
ncbi:MAG: 50S ribosomal protein L25/general stress protein Ctc [Pseudomonadota bacterium]